MPTGPNGEKRPADPVANAVHVMRIATGQIEETYAEPGPSESPRQNPPQEATHGRRDEEVSRRVQG